MKMEKIKIIGDKINNTGDFIEKMIVSPIVGPLVLPISAIRIAGESIFEKIVDKKQKKESE